jgi:hypothetical protein
VPIVYVVQANRKHDMVPAMRFGDLKELLPEDEGIVLSTAPTIGRLRRGLKNFSDADYLLLAGDPIAIGLAAMVAADFNNGRVKMLKWHKREQRYFEITADVHLRPLKEAA